MKSNTNIKVFYKYVFEISKTVGLDNKSKSLLLSRKSKKTVNIF